MRTILASLFLISVLSAQQPATSKVQAVFKPGTQDEFITITDANGRVFKNARVVKLDDKFILRFVHEDGAAALPLADFPAEVKARFRLDELKSLKADSSASASHITSASATQYTTSAATTKAASSAADGSNIQNSIAARAAQKWPNSYSMQEFVIKDQTESLIKIGRIINENPDRIPRDVLNRIIKESEKAWPDEYSMMLFRIEQELATWKRLNRP